MFQGSAFSLHPCFFYKNCLDFYSSFSTINHIRFSSTLIFQIAPKIEMDGIYYYIIRFLYYSFWRYSYVTRLDTSFRIPGESSPQNASSFQNAMKVVFKVHQQKFVLLSFYCSILPFSKTSSCFSNTFIPLSIDISKSRF